MSPWHGASSVCVGAMFLRLTASPVPAASTATTLPYMRPHPPLRFSSHPATLALDLPANLLLERLFHAFSAISTSNAHLTFAAYFDRMRNAICRGFRPVMILNLPSLVYSPLPSLSPFPAP